MRVLRVSLLMALVGCEDVTEPPRTVARIRPVLELAAEYGSRIPLGSITARPGMTVGSSYGIEVNEYGQVAGGNLINREEGGQWGGSVTRAAFWSEATGMVEIPVAYGAGPYCLDDQSIAAAINSSGRVAGYAQNCDTGQRAFSWKYGEDPVELSTPAGGASSAFDINTGGVIAGSFSGLEGGTRAVIWTSPGARNLLPDFRGYLVQEATGINDAGDVVGYAAAGDGISDTFVVWPHTGGVIPVPIPDGWRRYDIARINDRGLVVGGMTNSFGEVRAFLWNPVCGGLIDLGPGAAYAIDQNGRVVGDGLGSAFAWTAEGGRIPLSLLRAYGISNDGHVVGETLEEGGMMTRVMFSNPNGTPAGNAGGSYTIDEGGSVVLGTPSPPNPHGYPLCFSWDFDGGVTVTTPTVPRTFANDTAIAYTLSVTDAQGMTGTVSGTVTVNNVLPTAAFGAPVAVDEGSDFTLTLANAFDPSPTDAAGLQFAFDCGRDAGYGAFRSRNNRTCAAPNDDVRTVRGRVADDDGFTEYTATVTINNVVPVIIVDSNQVTTVTKNTPFTIAFVFYDPGVRDRWSYTVNFGAGASCAPVTYAFDATPALAPGTTYTATCPGGYGPPKKGEPPPQLTITVSDRDGGSSTASVPITVTK